MSETRDSSQPSDNTESQTDRKYLRITPTDGTLSPHTVATQFRRLHELNSHAERSRLDVLFDRTDAAPTIEWLLLSPAHADTLDYYIGIDPSTQLETLAHILRGLFPDDYELERTTWQPATLSPDADNPYTAGVEFLGCPDRPTDWQTQLTSFESFHTDDAARVPLAAIVEELATTELPVVYQTLLRPLPDWTGRADERRIALEQNHDRSDDTLFAGWLSPPDETTHPTERIPGPAQDRLEELNARDARNCFGVNARAAVFAPAETDAATADDVAASLVTALGHVGHSCYDIEGVIRTDADETRFGNTRTGTAVYRDIANRVYSEPVYEGWRTRLPGSTTESRGIVADPSEVGNFCLLGGDALTVGGTRAVGTTPDERTAIPRPPMDQLTRYQGPGLPLGRPITQDGSPHETAVTLPPSLQPLHVGWFGRTGSGKSTSIVSAILDNHVATDGADILIDPKGGDMPVEYLRAHYARHGSLENVYYFDCADTLPALSFFDIRDQLADGIDRAAAVEDTVDHYLEILRQVMGADRFDRAVRSPDIIRYLVKALFDPVHGTDAFGHRDLEAAAATMHQTRDPPPVSDDDLARMLGGIAANSKRSFDELMQGVANRIEKVPADKRLGRVFNHVPQDDGPQFDFRTLLDEDAVVVFDLGALRPEAQRVLTLVLLSQLWTALKRRKRQNGGSSLVNLYLEEAASVAVSDLVGNLLAKGREFNLSVTLAMQFPGQLREQSHAAYTELLNNIATIVTGNVAVDDQFARRFATADMAPSDVGNRLRALARGQWLASVPASFAETEPRPFLLASGTLPPGHPEGPEPFAPDVEPAVDAAITRVTARTQSQCGLSLATQSPATDETTDEEDETVATTTGHLTTTLPLTKRLPDAIMYDTERRAIVCTACGSRYSPTRQGVANGVTCCHDLADVDRDEIPAVDVNLKLSAAERADADYTDRQLAFLQVVYNAHQQQYDPEHEYDIVNDSMIRLQEYVGIESEAIEELVADDLLRHDGDTPHRLYTVTSIGRKQIHESHREGINHGDGAGDLTESSQHVLAVELGRRYLEQAFVADADSPVVEAATYYPVGDNSRLDAVGLDADDEVVVTVEAERGNNDLKTGVPSDYDKMAACDPAEAIWITMGRQDAHDVLQALNDPKEGNARVEKTYSDSTPPRRFTIDTPGCTEVYTLRYVRDTLLEE